MRSVQPPAQPRIVEQWAVERRGAGDREPEEAVVGAVALDEQRPFVELGEPGGDCGLEGEEGGVGGVVRGECEGWWGGG